MSELREAVDKALARTAPPKAAPTGLEAMAQDLVDTVKHYVSKRVEALERRIAELETDALRFEGPHDPGRPEGYERGAIVQQAGATWVCLARTVERPGSSASWRRIGVDR